MTFLWRCCCYGAILITISIGIVANNFDVDNVIVYEDAAGSDRLRPSYSGFSVALWNPGGNGLKDSWVLIGAPRANTTEYAGIKEPGTVFRCKIGEQCKEWLMDTHDYKGPMAGSWLGGSIDIRNGGNPSVVVCAPRWLDQNPKISNNVWSMKGICYQTNAAHPSELKIKKSELKTKNGVPLLPFENVSDGKLVMEECGFSIHIVPDVDSSIILGCPGFSDARGIPIQYKPQNKEFLIPSLWLNSNSEDYEYSGYAITSGYYFGLQYGRYYASSAPRSENLYGTVSIFTSFPPPRDNTNSLRGQQVGEYFGYALASCDIDGDGNDDLIVGAPQWTKIVDEGRIYYYSKNLRDTLFYDGEMPRGRFGSAITCLGDINYDGYADVAVGAPHQEKGVVYIYHGGIEGLTRAQTLSGPLDTKGFGISISQPVDIDNNYHPDIAVGAYLSGHVTVFRSKRAVTISVNFKKDLSEISLPIDSKPLSIQICSSYEGKHAPNKLDVTGEFTVDAIYQRAEIENDATKARTRTLTFSETLKLNAPSCQTFKIYLKNDARTDFLHPLTLSVTKRLNTTNQRGILLVTKHNTSGEEFFHSSSAVMNTAHGVAEGYWKLPFAVKCKENVCNSHLSINMETNLKNDNLYVIGAKKQIQLIITVHNSGDHAYLAEVTITMPAVVQPNHNMPATCKRGPPISGNIQVICDIGNPLNSNGTKTVILSLDMSGVKFGTPEIYLNATATTHSKDAAAGDHTIRLPINLIALTDIGIIRKMSKDQYSYTRVGKDEELPSTAFEHIYEIQNYEETPIEQAMLSVSIPTHWIQGGDQIEIARLNKTTGYFNAREFSCTDSETDKNVSSLSHDATTETEWWTGPKNANRSESMRDEKFTIINDRIFASSPDNRTLNINCTNPSVKCKTINCNLRFGGTEPVAKLRLLLELLLSNFSSEMIQEKDIIFFVTNSSVKILGSPRETVNNEPNIIMVGTKFIGYPPENKVPIWIIVLSIFVGLLLLVLLILGLWKFGFFERSKKMELRALLRENDEANPEPATSGTSN